MYLGWPYKSILDNVLIPLFHSNGESVIPNFINDQIPRNIFLAVYRGLPTIEEIPEKERTELKLYINDLFPEKTEEEKTDAMKVVYSLGNSI